MTFGKYCLRAETNFVSSFTSVLNMKLQPVYYHTTNPFFFIQIVTTGGGAVLFSGLPVFVFQRRSLKKCLDTKKNL